MGALKMRKWKMQQWKMRAGAYRRGGKCRSEKCRSDKVWKAIGIKYSEVPDEIWLSWLSCVLVAKRNSQANRRIGLLTLLLSTDLFASFLDIYSIELSTVCQMSAELPAVWPSDAPRNACRYLTAMRTCDCSFYVQLAIPSAQRKC